jgi:hypothetical protein
LYVAVDQAGQCLYVGSTQRPGTIDIRGRVRQHDRVLERLRTWAALDIIPIERATLADVRSIEGYAGRIMRPTQNMRLPRAIPLELAREDQVVA